LGKNFRAVNGLVGKGMQHTGKHSTCKSKAEVRNIGECLLKLDNIRK
jgi:hypothetical protein